MNLYRLDNRKCPLCGEKVNISDLKDEISVREFTISGMCQNCQDEMF